MVGRGGEACVLISHRVKYFETWDEVGARVSEAREAEGLTQVQLATQAGLDRTALAKIERGRRGLSSLELARLADVLDRPVEWFIREAPPAVVSRRAERIDSRGSNAVDVLLERIARGIELLLEIEALPPRPGQQPRSLRSLAQAEELARDIHQQLGEGEGGLPNIQAAAERFGLYAFSFEFPDGAADGAYIALEGTGVAVINGSMATGRRRFTLAHELGHHVLADAFSTDYALVDEITQTRERMINAFAIHLLMPRTRVSELWRQHDGADDPRSATIQIATEFRVSWTAACAHLKNLKFIDEETRQVLVARPPRRAEYLESGLVVVEELAPPSLPPKYVAAVVKAFRRHKITRDRALELAYGILVDDDLPEPHEVPLDALRAELQPAG
jgi:Zn-dependent peptidase ImmA (M78 family)/DNA-binding XRE family transcriptional regulator